MTPVSAQVTLLNRSSSLYGYGRMQTLTMLDAKNQPPMFNPFRAVCPDASAL